jgi:hypothetical protein
MPSDRKPSPTQIAVSAFVVLLALYIGEYYRSVLPIHYGSGRGRNVSPSYNSCLPMGWEGLGRFFDPINRLDRLLRPRVWQVTQEERDITEQLIRTAPEFNPDAGTPREPDD